MIGIVDCDIQAANPSMPLYPMRAFVNSPSSLRIRNVPKKIGTWNITSVQLVAAYPDNSIKTADCKLIGCVWVGTIAGSTISGTSENGYTVYASGIDENGNEVSNYVLGKGLVEILEADGTITPGQDTAYVHLLDEEPENPKEGDLYPVTDGYALWADGKANLLKGMTETEAGQMDSMQIQINDEHAAIIQIGGLIPPQASTSNQLADKAFVNSSVQTATANFRGNWATWNIVPTNPDLYPVDYAGNTTPTVNDYLVVQDASGYVGFDVLEGTWRFKYSGTWTTDGKNGWLPEYQVNETPMTAAQLAAINSNITAAKVAQYDNALEKQRYALVDKTPPPHTLSSTVTLDDRAINTINVMLDWMTTGWEMDPVEAFAPTGSLSLPVWNATTEKWESTGLNGYVLIWDDGGGGEETDYVEYFEYGNTTVSLTFGKAASALSTGDTITASCQIKGEQVNTTFTVKTNTVSGDDCQLLLNPTSVTLSNGIFVALEQTSALVIGASETSASQTMRWKVDYWGEMLYDEGQNVTALEFPSAVSGKARDFLVRFVSTSPYDNITIPSFPANLQYFGSSDEMPTI